MIPSQLEMEVMTIRSALPRYSNLVLNCSESERQR